MPDMEIERIIYWIQHNPLLYAIALTIPLVLVNIVLRKLKKESITLKIVLCTIVEIFVTSLLPTLFPHGGEVSLDDRSLIAIDTEQASLYDAAHEASPSPRVTVMQGLVVQFGQYEQSYPCDGADPIEWIVLQVDASRNCALLLSRKGLDCKQYHDKTGVNVSWKNADIRHWLNNSFLSLAFSSEEQTHIVPTVVSDVKDHVFLLDESEFNRYSGMYEVTNCYPTLYACFLGTTENETTGKTSWWLRADSVKTNGVWVGTKGEAHTTGNKVTITNNSVRPAVWVDYDYLDSLIND